MNSRPASRAWYRWREAARGAGLALASLVLCLLSLEGVLRWILTDRFVYRTPSFQVESVHPEDGGQTMREPLLGAGLRFVESGWGYGLKRDLRARLVSSEFDVSFRTNSLGLRGPEIAPRPSAFRVLGLGDSFAMGFGVEEAETYLTRLAGFLGDAEPVNAGVIGYAPGNSVEYLQKAGLALDPDLVILQLWVVDDLCTGAAVTRPDPYADLPPMRAWRERVRSSHLLMFLRDRLRQVPAVRRRLLAAGAMAPFPALAVLDDRFAQQCGGLSGLRALLERADRRTRDAGGRLLVLLLPAREQVYPEDLERALVYNLRDDRSHLDVEAPNRAMAQVANASGIELVDALPRFRRLAGGPRLYFERYDPHLTAHGHLATARLLADHLTAHPQPPIPGDSP